MYEYQFSVSHNGAFIFRTEWSRDNAISTSLHLSLVYRNVDGYKIVKNKRNPSYEQEVIAN